MLDLTGRGERIRTSDLTVPNDRRGKNVSLCLFESCSHQGISSVLHPFLFFTIRYRLSADNSVHKLATHKASAFLLKGSHWTTPSCNSGVTCHVSFYCIGKVSPTSRKGARLGGRKETLEKNVAIKSAISL